MATAVLTKTVEPPTETQLASRYAGDLIYHALVEAGEPLKAGDVVKAVGRPDVDLRLARVILSTNAGMTAVDRRWTLWSRFYDNRNIVDTNTHRILNAYGQPMHLHLLARELAIVYGRQNFVYEEMLTRALVKPLRFVRLGADYVIPRNWLLDIEPGEDDEVQFENFLEDEDVYPFVEAADAANLSANDPASIAAFLDAVNTPVKSKALQFLAYRRDRADFDALAFYSALFLHSGATPLGDATYIGPALAEKIVQQFPVLAEQEVSENAEAEAQEAAKPLVIGDAEREPLVAAVLNSDGTVHATRLLEDIFEITPDFRTYNEDLQTVIRTLAEDDRVLWVGADRFRPQGTLPGYVFSVPGLLEIPEYDYRDAEGVVLDQLIQEEGFDGGLEREIMNPLAQDVLDEEPVTMPDPNPPSNARAVVKYHHKEIGTLPLCQFPPGFFPPEPTILETEFLLPGSLRATVYINNETRLLYGLLDWFQSIPIDSGATFTLERQAPDRYLVNYNDESEPTMFISRNRVNELLTLQERAETEELPTFEIVREIMEHYRKGIEFLTLLTEVNIVRRVPRRLVASILSEYYCFFQRGGAWVYDAKKLVQGFDKSKRKYIPK